MDEPVSPGALRFVVTLPSSLHKFSGSLILRYENSNADKIFSQ